MLDEATVLRRCYVPPWDNSTFEKRFYSIDWPAFARYVWRAVFSVTGWRWPEFDDEHYEFDGRFPLNPRNIRPYEGGQVPRDAVRVLRIVAAGFLTLACFAMAAMALDATGSAFAGVAAALPLLLHPAAGQWLVGYPGTDAVILFWMLLFAALWVGYHKRRALTRLSAVLVMAFVAGLAAGTKINGGLLTAAFAPCLALYSRGWRRLWAPLLFCGVAFLVFVAVNPVLWQPGAGGLVQGIRDIFARRLEVMKRQENLNILPRVAYFQARRFLLPVVPWAALALYLARREKWFVPAVWWSAAVFLGSYFALNRYDPRLGFPLDAALTVPTMLAALHVIRRLRERLTVRMAARKDKAEGPA